MLCAWYVRRALRAGAAGTRAGGRRKDAPRGSYRDAFLELGDSLVAFCVMEAVIGLLNSFMLAGSVTFRCV